MDNALVRFIGLAPKDIIELICNYLDFSEFLALTSVSRYVRSILVNHHLFWLNYYMKRGNFRHYEGDALINDKSTSKYQLRMPSFDKRAGITDGANRLLNSARKVEIMNTETALSTNPMLNLSILDNFKRSRWKGEFKQYTENLSRFTLPTMVVPTLGCNPFLVVSNNSVCGFNMNEDKFMFNNFMTPLNDHRRYEIKICCWVRLDDSSYTEGLGHRGVTSRVSNVPKILLIVYRTGMNTLSLSFYVYDDGGFMNTPSMKLKMSIEGDDYVSAIDVYASLSSWDGRDVGFSYMNIFVGTGKGKVLQKRMEEDRTVIERKEQVCDYEITSLRYVSCHTKAVVVVFSYGNYLGVVDVSNQSWNLVENIKDSVVTFSIDTPNCLMAYSTSYQNRSTYVDLYNSKNDKAHYLVPKPPFCILSLERDSKWAIVIRNYIRVLQVIHPNESDNVNRGCTYKKYEDYSSDDSTKDYAFNENGTTSCNCLNGVVSSRIPTGLCDCSASRGPSGLSGRSSSRSPSGLDPSRTTGIQTGFNMGVGNGFSSAIGVNGYNGNRSPSGTYSRNSTSGLTAMTETARVSGVDGTYRVNGMSRVNSYSSVSNMHLSSGSNSMSGCNGSNRSPASENELGLERLNLRMNCDKHGSSGHKLKFKSICTLNGHFNDITHCVHDGWSKLVTIDSSHNLFVWDYTIGCKIFSFSLLADMKRNVVHVPYVDEFENKNKKGNFKRVDSKCSIRSDSTDGCYSGNGGGHNGYKKDLNFKRSVKLINRMVSNSDMKDAIEDFLYLDESDYDVSPLSSSDEFTKTSQRSHRSKNIVPASNIKGLLDPNKKGQKYHVDVSVQSLIVYYKSCNIMQVWSFK